MTLPIDQALADELAQARLRVVAEAMRWVHTPYRHHGDVLGLGVDCAMLLVRVFVDTGLVEPFDPRPYSPQWHLHRNAERYLDWFTKVADPTETPKPGDVAVWRFGRTFSHGAILVSGDGKTGTVVHALAPVGEVTIQSVTDEPIANRQIKWYSVFDRLARRARELGDA